MSDEGDNNFNRYIYTGAAGEHVPRDATHIIVREDVTIVRRRAFEWCPKIIEVIYHDKFEKIERLAFDHCRHFFRRAIIRSC